MHTHRQCSSFIFLALALRLSLLLKQHCQPVSAPAGYCSPEGAVSSCSGDGSCGGWTAVTPAVATRGQRPSTGVAARASAGQSAGGQSQASCYLLRCGRGGGGGVSWLCAFLFQLPSLQHSSLPWILEFPSLQTSSENPSALQCFILLFSSN